MNENIFLNQKSIETLIQRLREHAYKSAVERNNLVLDLIRQKQPISKYELAKLSGLSYNTIKTVCRWAEASQFIFSTLALGENGMPVKMVATNIAREKVNGFLTKQEKDILTAQPFQEEKNEDN